MRIDIATLFPEMCEAFLGESIVGRARRAGYLEINCHNIRDYSGSLRDLCSALVSVSYNNLTA